MAVWVDPFTGNTIDTGDQDSPFYRTAAPLGSPTPMRPAGTVTQWDPITGATGFRTPSGFYDEDTTALMQSGQFTADRGRVLYMPGDEWKIIQSQSNLLSLQKRLEALGVLDGDYLEGSPDEKTAAAMKKVLEAANATGQKWDEVLAAAGGGKPSGQKKQPLVIELTDPDTLRAVLQNGAQKMFGRFIGEDTIQKVIDGYRAQEAAYQTAQNGPYDPNTGEPTGATGMSTVNKPPSEGGFNLQAVRQMYADHPVTAEMSQFIEHLGQAMNTFTQPVNSRG